MRNVEKLNLPSANNVYATCNTAILNADNEDFGGLLVKS
jgi:hypothetical protein